MWPKEIVRLKGRCLNLGDVRGKHAGRAAVVCGAGPSLRFVDSRMYKHVVIAVNDAFSKLPEAPYYFSTDPSMVMHKHWDEVEATDCVVAVTLPDWCFKENGTMAGVPARRVLHVDKHVAFKMLQTDGKLIYGPSSGHVAVHLAYVMGCSPIYLVGCDCRCESGKKYFWEFQNQPGGGMKDGYATYHLSEMARTGKKLAADQYDDWYKRDGTPTGDGMAGWRQLMKENPGLQLFDASGLAGGGAIAELGVLPSADILDVMGRRA